MKELKFKMWDIDRKEMHIVHDLYFFEEEGITEVVDGVASGTHASYKILQYIGLKDRNGKEIYEGDILKSWDGHVGTVIFEDGMFNVEEYYDGSADYPTIAFSEGVFEVIGNICENPELLSKEE